MNRSVAGASSYRHLPPATLEVQHAGVAVALFAWHPVQHAVLLALDKNREDLDRRHDVKWG